MNSITVGDQVIDIGSEARITIFTDSIGTVCVGGNDLFDLGLRYSEIEKANHIAKIKIGNVTIELARNCDDLIEHRELLRVA